MQTWGGLAGLFLVGNQYDNFFEIYNISDQPMVLWDPHWGEQTLY